MHTEYQINIEYADGLKDKYLTYRFENEEIRNELYQLICSTYKNDIVDDKHLRNHGGLMLGTYDYSEPVGNEIAQFVPQTSFKIEVLSNILEMVKRKAVS